MSPAEELADLVDSTLPSFRAAWGHDHDDSWEVRMAWQLVLADEGWVAPSWPVEHGGRGLTPAERIAADEVLATRGTPVIASTLGVKNVGPTIAAWGTDEQKRHLPRILDGTEIWCQGFSEPDHGSDLAGLRCAAVRDGDDFVVNGEKIWTSAGLRATHCQLLARTDPAAAKHRGISALLVALDTPGIERRPIRQLDGRADFVSISFTDVRVPAIDLLGPENDGWRVTMTTLAHERSGIAMFATRHEQEVADYIETMRRRGVADPTRRQELMRRFVEARILGAQGRAVLIALAEGREPGPEQSIIKLAWSLAAQRFAATRFDGDALPASVGLAPADLDRFLASRSMTIAAGTTEVMKNIVGERVLGLPREPAGPER